jgi:TolB protein
MQQSAHRTHIVRSRAALLAIVAGLAAGCASSRPVYVEASPAPVESHNVNAIFDDAAALSAPAYTASLALFGDVNPGATPGGDGPAAPGENYRQISFALEGADFDPSLSPDGKYMYFSSTAHAPSADIYVKSVDGRSVTQLTADPASDVMPAVSPDGSRIAFASNRGGSWDLFVINSTGGQAVEVTSDSSQELNPTWSPDGRYLAYARMGETSGRWEIWVTEVNRNAVKRFLTYGLFPDWHPTQNKIVFQRARDRGERLFSIWTLDMVKGEATALTELASSPLAALINPKWSSDGERIAFAAVMNPENARDNTSPVVADIWVMDSKGGGRTNLTGGRYANLMPAWGPDNAVFFVSDRGGIQNVWSADTTQAALAASPVNGKSATAAAQPQPAEQPTLQPAMQPMPAHAQGAPVKVNGPQVIAPTESEHEEPAPEIANVPISPDQ